MTTKNGERMAAQVVAGLEALGLKSGTLHQMAKKGQLLELACEMPTCLCPHGRTFFAMKEHPMPDWAPNTDHYPALKNQKGELKADNVRLAHTRCNNSDFGTRSKISAMLLKEHMSLEAIAAKLNGAGGPAPYGGPKWTAATVRRAMVS